MKRLFILIGIVLMAIVSYSQNNYRIQQLESRMATAEQSIVRLTGTCGITGPTGPTGATGATGATACKVIFSLPIDTLGLMANIKYPFGFTTSSMIVDSVFIVMTRTGASTPDIYVTLKFGKDISVAGTEMMASTEIKSYSTVTKIYSFTSSQIPVDDIIWAVLPTATTIPKTFYLQVFGH